MESAEEPKKGRVRGGTAGGGEIGREGIRWESVTRKIVEMRETGREECKNRRPGEKAR